MKAFVLCFLLLFSTTENAPTIDSFSKKAVEEHKEIAVYFSGSDWCTNCHQFSKAILAQDSVKDLLENHFVYYIADFPQRKKLEKETRLLNDSLAEKLNPEGHFPLLVITDEHWNIKAMIRKGEDMRKVMEKLQNNIPQ